MRVELQFKAYSGRGATQVIKENCKSVFIALHGGRFLGLKTHALLVAGKIAE